MKLLGISMCMLCCSLNGAVLVNPGFETGNFTGWTIGGTSTSFGVATAGTIIPGTDFPFTPAFVAVHSGDFAAFANVDCNTDIGCTPRLIFTLSQIVALSPNSTYSAGFYLADDSSSGMGVLVGDADMQIFVNGVGILQPTGVINIPGDGTFQLFSGSFSTGASAIDTITFQINGSGTSRAGVSLDDFFVQAAPEPATLPLISFLAMLFILWRRNHPDQEATRP